MDIQANGWQLAKISCGPDSIKSQRLAKIMYPKFYPVSIYLDANFYITGKLSEFLNNHYKGGILTIKHPNRTLLSEEAKQIVKLKKDNPRNVNDHMAMLRLLTVPDNCGMYASGIIVRDNSALLAFSNKWAELLLRGSHRDQLSMGPAAWLTGTKIDTISWEEMQKYFKLTPHKRNAGLL
jgi:hypothetical protein